MGEPAIKFNLGECPKRLEENGVAIEPFDNAKHGEEYHKHTQADPEHFIQANAMPWFTSLEQASAFIDGAHADETTMIFVILETSTGKDRVAGFIGLHSASPANLSSGAALVVFKPYRRTHVQTGARWPFLRWAFDTLQLRRLEAKVYSYNSVALASALRVGYTPEGLQRNSKIVDPKIVPYGRALPVDSPYGAPSKGTSLDAYLLAITSEDWGRGVRTKVAKLAARKPVVIKDT